MHVFVPSGQYYGQHLVPSGPYPHHHLVPPLLYSGSRGRCPTEIETTLKLEINSLSRWVEKRTALRSIRKKTYNIHASKIRLVNAHGMNTVCNGVNVEAKSVVNYLGTIFISA